MSVRCAIGWHDMKPQYRKLDKPVEMPVLMLWVPSLFSGPPCLIPTGLTYMTDEKLTHWQCSRCGRKQP